LLALPFGLVFHSFSDKISKLLILCCDCLLRHFYKLGALPTELSRL